jgi:hypothetical protein
LNSEYVAFCLSSCSAALFKWLCRLTNGLRFAATAVAVLLEQAVQIRLIFWLWNTGMDVFLSLKGGMEVFKK